MYDVLVLVLWTTAGPLVVRSFACVSARRAQQEIHVVRMPAGGR